MSRYLPRLFILSTCVLALSGCLGNEVKTLGQKATGGKGNGTTDSESFSITLAYRRDADPDDQRLITLQGIRGLASASLANVCGTTGATCKCKFYKSTSDTAPLVPTAANGMSTKNNSLTCTIPGTTDPDLYTKIIVSSSDGTKSTGFIDIKTTLTIEDVIGDLDKTKVRGIYRYSCSRIFFEGEGVSPSEVACPSGQRLGLITAAYNFYLFNSQSENNLSEKGSSSAYEEPICLRQFNKVVCDNAPDLRWGLYAEQTDVFERGITMVSKPEGENAVAVYGFVALPDTAGNCPTGLIKVQQWMAQPQSIIQGSIDGLNPPSSFVNTNNGLSDKVVEIAQPTAFAVNRQKNSVPCSSGGTTPGDCTAASFGGVERVQNVTYSGLTPIVCAIPKELLSGLF